MIDEFKHQAAAKTTEELLDIYVNPADYQPAYAQVVLEELVSRNVEVEAIKQQRAEMIRTEQAAMEQGKEGNATYIILCYVFAIFGGVGGIVGGYIYNQSTHRSFSGQRFYVYNKETRKQGKFILVAGFFGMLLTLLWKLS